MNLLVISHLFPNATKPLLGIFVENQLRHLAAQNIRITVLVPVPWANALMARISRKWRDYHRIETRRDYGIFLVEYVRFLRLPGAWYRPLSGSACFYSLRRHIRKNHPHARFDTILANSIIPDGEAALRLADEYGIPAFCYAVGEDLNVFPFQSRRMHARTRHILEHLAGLFTTGSDLARIARDICAQAKVKPLFRGCDLTHFAPDAKTRTAARQRLSFSANDLVISYLGFLRADKGLRELMAAFSRLARIHERLRLLIIGDGPLRTEFERWIAENELQQRVTMAGETAHQRSAELLNAADIFVFPSYHEGLPNAVVEAAACMLPVIGTNIPGIRDVLGPDYESWLVPPRDAGALEAKLHALITDPTARHHLATLARDRAETFFDIRKNSEELYRHLLRGHIS